VAGCARVQVFRVAGCRRSGWWAEQLSGLGFGSGFGEKFVHCESGVVQEFVDADSCMFFLIGSKGFDGFGEFVDGSFEDLFVCVEATCEGAVGAVDE